MREQLFASFCIPIANLTSPEKIILDQMGSETAIRDQRLRRFA